MTDNKDQLRNTYNEFLQEFIKIFDMKSDILQEMDQKFKCNYFILVLILSSEKHCGVLLFNDFLSFLNEVLELALFKHPDQEKNIKDFTM